jgi:hypothetical protein
MTFLNNELGSFDDALLAYDVTTDEVEAEQQAEREERIEAAKRILADRARRRAAEGEAAAHDEDQDA